MHLTDSLLRVALAHHKNGNSDEAARQYHALLEREPRHAGALFHLGLLKHSQGDNKAAALLIERAITQQPEAAQFHFNLGVVYQALHLFDKALECFKQASFLKKDYAIAYFNAGVIYHHDREFDKALAAYGETLRFIPDHIASYNNRGAIFDVQGDYENAMHAYQQAIRIKPDNAVALSNLAGIYKNLNRIPEAISCFKEALKIQPDSSDIHSNLLLTLHYHTNETPASMLAAHREWDRQHGLPRACFQQPHSSLRDPQKQLRIGYVSGDFKTHPVGFFLLPVLASHHPEKTKIFCYSATERKDSVTLQLKHHADVWHDVPHHDDNALSELIRRDEIDILVDLSGHTADNRLTVFACKPAPIQVSWLGYFNTTGMSAMDYFISDNVHTPSGHDKWFTEQVIRLPDGYNCYAPPTHVPDVTPETPASRNGYVTFGCFNNVSKLNDAVIALWAGILQSSPNSRLLLKSQGLGNSEVQEKIREKFLFFGIKESRIIMEGWSSYYEMLERYAEVDIALDPFPFSGGLTSCDALWMGVPVVTCAGSWTVSRQTASYLTQIGLTGCITTDKESYAARALELSKSPPRLSAIRAQLRARMAASSLCDGRRFTKNLESAYRDMWKTYCEG